MTIPLQRAAVLAEAASWLRTPFHHQARLKNIGVDCAQLIDAIYHAVIPGWTEHDFGNYPNQWMVHSDDERYLEWARSLCREVATTDPGDLKPGDLAIFQFGRSYSHGAIVVKWPDELIHAEGKDYMRVIKTSAEQVPLARHKVLFFSPWK